MDGGLTDWRRGVGVEVGIKSVCVCVSLTDFDNCRADYHTFLIALKIKSVIM